MEEKKYLKWYNKIGYGSEMCIRDSLMALYDEQYGYQQSNVESGSFVSCIPEINEKYMTNEHMKQYYTCLLYTSRCV